MRVVTDRPMILEDHSNAGGKERRQQRRAARQAKRSDRQAGKGGRKEARLEKRAERKAGRMEKRAERQERRKARRNARKLKWDKDKDGKITFRDFIPRLRQQRSNTGQLKVVKDNPDGTTTEVPAERVETITDPQTGTKVQVDSTDVQGTQTVSVDPNGNVTATLGEDQVEEMTFDDGSTGFARRDDVEGGARDEKGWKSLSTGAKVGIIAAGVVVSGVLAFVIYKAVTKNKGKAKGKK